jgi:ADP-heptose:LPS heptosyltransferase
VINGALKWKIYISTYYRLALYIRDIFLISALKLYTSCSADIKYEICVVKLDLIGDFFVWYSSLSEPLRNILKKNGLIICNENLSDYIRQNDIALHVIGVDIKSFLKNFRYRFKLLKNFSKISPSVTINARPSRQILIDDVVIFSINRGKKIGAVGLDVSQSSIEGYLGSLTYTDRVTMPYDKSEFHNYGLLNDFFLQSNPNTQDEIQQKTLKKRNKCFLNKNEYIVISTFTSWSPRAWPEDEWILLIESLLVNYQSKIILVGASNENLGLKMTNYVQGNPRILNLIGKQKISNLVGLIENASLVIANETSLVHIAAFCNVPSICLLGGGHFKRFLPYSDSIPELLEPVSIYSYKNCFGCNWRCNHPDFDGTCVPCVKQLTVNSVIAEVNNLIKKSQEIE